MHSVLEIALGAEMVRLFADGPADLAAVGWLARIDPVLDGADRVELIRAWERCRAMLDGAQQRALCAVADATEGRGLAEEQARHEVGAALRLSPPTAGERTWVATSLRRRLPGDTGRAAGRRHLYLQAAHLVAAVRELDDAAASRVEARVLGRASEQTVAEFRRSVAGPCSAVDPASAADRHKKASGPDHRRARAGCESTGATRSHGRPARPARPEQGPATALAPHPGLDALRLDVLVHAVLHNGGADPQDPLLTKTATAETGTGAAGKAPKCSCGGAQSAAVVIDLATLLGLADNPGEIPGYGPIPAPMARAMARDRDWIRWTVDPVSGQLLDRGARHLPALGQAARASSPTATGSAASPAATGPPNSATATTSSPSPTTARPSGSTSDRSAASTTTPRPTDSGNSATTPTPAPRPGPAHWARPTPSPPTHL